MSDKKHHQHEHAKAGAAHGRKPITRGDWIIIVFFALIGFLGSVYLFRTGSPAIIVSTFLAAGVASLVYGFLGGLEASFQWGPGFKAGGALAALLGSAFFFDYHLKTESLPVFPTDGIYEWQYGGQSWQGHVEVGKNRPAQFEMLHFYICGTQWKGLPHMTTEKDTGRVEWTDTSHMKLHVRIPFKYVNYDASCKPTGLSEQEVLEGDLTAVPAFAGDIYYHSKDREQLGHMVLVKYIQP